nr:MerR family DNA-binding protein [Paracoccus saliphilus]
MSLYEDRESAAAEAKQIARHHMCRVEQKIAELQSLAATLQHLVALCVQGDRPECPILHDLAQMAQDQDTSSSRHFEQLTVDIPEAKA